MKNKRLRNTVAVLAVAVLAVMIAQTDLAQILDSLKQINPLLLALLIALQLVTETLLTVQWCQIAKLIELPYSLPTMLYINAKGTVMEAVTPGAKVGGEVTRAIMFKEHFDYSTSDSVSVIAVQKIISISSLVAMGLLALMFMPSGAMFLQEGSRKIILAALAVLLALFMLLLFAADNISGAVNRRKSKIKWISAVQKWVTEFSAHLDKVKGKRIGLLLQFVLSVFIWALFPYKLVLLTKSFGVPVNTLGLFATTLLSYLVAMIPILPGGLGSFEITMGGMLALMGLTVGQSLVISASFRFVTFWFVVIASLLVSAVGGYIKRRITDEKSKLTTRMDTTSS